MIPWMREKIAERKARWQQNRKQRDSAASGGSASTVTDGGGGEPSSSHSGSTSSVATAASSSAPSPSSSSFRGNSPRNFRFSTKHQRHHNHHHHHHHSQQQQQATTSGDRSRPTSSASAGSACRSGGSGHICGLVASTSSSAKNSTTTTVVPLRIISPRGGIVGVEVPPDCSGAQLKTYALDQFASCSFSLPHFSSDVDELISRYKLIRARNRTVVQDGDTLEKLAVRVDEEFLLVVKRTDFIPPDENLKGPSTSEVLAATKHIPLSRINQATANFNVGMLQTDLQQDLRRILISLARASAFVIGSGRCAEKLIVLFNQRLINRRKHQVRSIETLLEMGFSLDKIHQALEITKNIFPAALDWLIQHDSSVKLLNCDTKGSGAAPQICTGIAAADDSGTNDDVPSTSTVPLPPLAVAETDIEEPPSTSQLASPSPHEDEPSTTPAVQQEEEDEATKFQRKLDNVETLLDIIRQYSDRDVFPAPDMVATIVEMGFEEKSVREALVATRNNQSAACEWLLGNRSKSLTELADGLPQDSPILQVLLASSQVQISLGNPKMFIALLSMLDNSSTMTMWLSDTDTAAVLGHILRTYHEEKHIVAINQFNNAQSFNRN
uniref:Ubiquitin-associated domain-containing protein 1 n=1 Tax=Culex pipiens TaxID=7175 RepID=A0A8D8FRV0_CULPI